MSLRCAGRLADLGRPHVSSGSRLLAWVIEALGCLPQISQQASPDLLHTSQQASPDLVHTEAVLWF